MTSEQIPSETQFCFVIRGVTVRYYSEYRGSEMTQAPPGVEPLFRTISDGVRELTSVGQKIREALEAVANTESGYSLLFASDAYYGDMIPIV